MRVVGDRTQFCFGALLRDDREPPLPRICSCQQKHLHCGGSHCSHTHTQLNACMLSVDCFDLFELDLKKVFSTL